ncbi:MAG: aminotransferase class V-fold PLP-dependent enzyme, partial [Clostridiales bacterium]|nr:aminotransferase class V-fold PLP-dependent enzyme [Clostridiales bacterium]
MNRVYNFAAGPSTMPVEALETAAKEMLAYGTSGMSVMEMSHRSKMYIEIFDETEAILRDLMHIPEEYAVLFLQGGATAQFAAIPMNLMNGSGKADYVDSG